MTTNSTTEILADFDMWRAARADISERDGSHGDVSSSAWQASDDAAFDLLEKAIEALRQPAKIWTLSVVDDDRPDKTPLTVTIHSTEEECWESLRENYDPEGLADDEPPVAIVAYLQDEQGLTIDIDVHEVAR